MNGDRSEFLSFLNTDQCAEIMREKEIKILIKTGNFFSTMRIPMKVFMTFFLQSSMQQKNSYHYDLKFLISMKIML